MAITGNLRTMQLSELLQWLSLGQKTGTLVIRGEPGEKRLFFRDGRIISSSSTVEREYLGNFLIAYGYITEEELTRAMEVQRESKILLGRILVMIGAIAEEEVSELLKLKAAETIYDIFLWTEGAFEFVDSELPNLPMVPISVDVTGIVLEGLRRYDEWQRIRTRIRSLREIPAIVAPVDMETLPDRERLLLAAIDGLRSIEELADATHNPDFFAARFVWELLEAGRADLVGIRESVLPSSQGSPGAVPEGEPVFTEAAHGSWSSLELPGDAFPSGAYRPAGEFHADAPPPTMPTTPIAAVHPVHSARSAQLQPVHPVHPVHPIHPIHPVAAVQAVPTLPVIPALDDAPRARPMGESTAFRKLADPEAGDARRASQVVPTAVPTLRKPLEELMAYSFTPNEAFILSRINGLWDVRSIARISPFPEKEVLRVFRKLDDGGVITWR
jgi:hypothetical protein